MYHSVKLLLVCFIVIILTGCNSTGKTSYKIENAEYETEEYRIEGEKISFSEKADCIKDLNEKLAGEFDSWAEDFKGRVALDSSEKTTKPCLQIRHIIKYNKNNILSVVTQKYAFINGVHGNTWWSAKNYDIEKNCELSLSDIFIDDTYVEIVNQRLSEIVEKNQSEYHDLWEQPQLSDKRQSCFYFDDNGDLVIFFEPYELSYYAKGVVEFTLKVEQIRGYIKPEYLDKNQ